MGKIIKKVTAGALAAAMAFGMAAAGAAGTMGAQAAENTALAAPFNFTGLDPSSAKDEDWDASGTRIGIDAGDVEAFSDKYTYSYKLFIPKAAVESENANIGIDTWLDLNSQDTYLGNVRPKYEYGIQKENGSVFLAVFDVQAEKWLDPEQYKDFISMSKAGDFYRITVKDLPARDLLNVEGDGENQQPIDTSKSGLLSINIRVTGIFAKLSSIMYLDDLSIKADGAVVYETDFSAQKMFGHYYEYTVGQEKDENRTQRPALSVLNTNLLKLGKASASIKKGKTVQIKATAAANGTITYKSSNKKVATVTAKGVVTGKKAGKANITVSANGISKTFKVTVKK